MSVACENSFENLLLGFPSFLNADDLVGPGPHTLPEVLYKSMGRGKAPRCISLCGRKLRWSKKEVFLWLETRAKKETKMGEVK